MPFLTGRPSSCSVGVWWVEDGEARVAATAAAAFGDDEALSRLGEIEQLLAGVGIVHDGADRDGNLDRSPSRPVRLLPSPWRPRSAECSGLKRKCKQGIVVRIGDHDDIAAASAIATAWSASRDVFLATECEAAIAAIAGLNFDFYFVYEHAEKRKRPLGRDPAAGCLLRERMVIGQWSAQAFPPEPGC